MSSCARTVARCAHPTIVMFPAVVLGTSVVLDAMHLNEPNWFYAQGANFALMVGLAAMAVALPFVILDCRALSGHARVMTKMYAAATVLSLACFAASWLLRDVSASSVRVPHAAVVFSFLGGANLLATAWLRDELLVSVGTDG